MNDLKFIPVEGEPNPEDKRVMVDGMLAYHASTPLPGRHLDSMRNLDIRSTESLKVSLKVMH